MAAPLLGNPDMDFSLRSEYATVTSRRTLSITDYLLIALLVFIFVAALSYGIRILYRYYRRRRRRARLPTHIANAEALARALQHASRDADGSFAVSRLNQVDCCESGVSLQQLNKECCTSVLKSSDGVCAVCLEGLKEGEKVRKLKCNHTFHDGCAIVWLVKSNQCPICRQEVVKKETSTSGRLNGLSGLRRGR